MTTNPERCARVRSHLPMLVADRLRAPRRRLVERHVRRCEECAAEAARQRRVTEDLLRLGAGADEDLELTSPPDDLLAALLDQAAEPGLRGRAAVPARGAISGARPGLTAALVLTVLTLAAAAAWAGWRLGRAFRD